MPDPIDNFLTDLGRLRAKVHTELLKLPAPTPARKALETFDRDLSRAEAEITRAVKAISPTTIFREATLPGLGKIQEISTKFPGGGSVTMIGGFRRP